VSYEFVWDYAKAGSNLEKHGVSFEEAVPSSPTRSRSTCLPRSRDVARHRLLVVAYAERPPRTRLISAREATRRERHDYEEGQE
jgi:hypothetical protein